MIKELLILIKMLFRSNPSDMVGKDLEVVEMNYFPFEGYKAMSWCGRIIHRGSSSQVNETTLNHEKIHLMQAMMCNDSWIRYYLSYLWEWLKCGFLAPLSANYMTSKYESEAYANEEDFEYCNNYDGSNLLKYTLKDRKKLYKQLGGTSKAWKQSVKTL